MIKRAIRNFTFLSVGQIFSRGIMFVALIYLARVIGPEGLGKIGFAQVFTSYFIFSTDIGLCFLGIREIAKDKGKIPDFVDTILSIKISLAAFLFILIVIGSILINKPPDIKILILIYGMVIFSFAAALDWFFLGVERMEFTGIVNSLRALVYLALVYIFVKSGQDIFKVAVFFLVSYCVSTILYFSLAKVYLSYSLKFRFDFKKWKNTAIAALPLGILVVLNMFMQQQSVLMLGFFGRVDEVGIYYGIHKIIFVVLVFIGLYADSIYPIFCYTEGKRVLLFSLMLIFTAFIPFAVLSHMFSADLIRFILSEKFISGVLCFRILIWIIPLTGLFAVLSKNLIAKNQEKQCLLASGGGLAINTIANLWLIPRYGLTGAAVSYVLGLSFTCLYLSYYPIRIAWQALRNLSNYNQKIWNWKLKA